MELQGPGQGPAGTYTDFAGCKKVKLEDGSSSKFKIKLSTCKLFCLSSQPVHAPLHKNKSCFMGTDASKHPQWTLTPATYHIHFQFNYLQSPSLKNKQHNFNPGILEEIFTFGILQLHKSTYKAAFPNLESDPKPTKCRNSHWLEHTLDPAPEDFSFFFFSSLLPLQLFQQGMITLIARYLVLIIYLYCYY